VDIVGGVGQQRAVIGGARAVQRPIGAVVDSGRSIRSGVGRWRSGCRDRRSLPSRACGSDLRQVARPPIHPSREPLPVNAAPADGPASPLRGRDGVGAGRAGRGESVGSKASRATAISRISSARLTIPNSSIPAILWSRSSAAVRVVKSVRLVRSRARREFTGQPESQSRRLTCLRRAQAVRDDLEARGASSTDEVVSRDDQDLGRHTMSDGFVAAGKYGRQDEPTAPVEACPTSDMGSGVGQGSATWQFFPTSLVRTDPRLSSAK
jgi:hypothetical protein